MMGKINQKVPTNQKVNKYKDKKAKTNYRLMEIKVM